MTEIEKLNARIRDLEKDYKFLYKDYVSACIENQNLKKDINVIKKLLTKKNKEEFELEKIMRASDKEIT